MIYILNIMIFQSWVEQPGGASSFIIFIPVRDFWHFAQIDPPLSYSILYFHIMPTIFGCETIPCWIALDVEPYPLSHCFPFSSFPIIQLIYQASNCVCFVFADTSFPWSNKNTDRESNNPTRRNITNIRSHDCLHPCIWWIQPLHVHRLGIH